MKTYSILLALALTCCQEAKSPPAPTSPDGGTPKPSPAAADAAAAKAPAAPAPSASAK